VITALLRDGNIIHGDLEKSLNWTVPVHLAEKNPVRCCRRLEPEQAECRRLAGVKRSWKAGRDFSVLPL